MMTDVTQKELRDISKALVELNRSVVKFNKLFEKKFAETVKDEREEEWIKINSRKDCPKTDDPVLIRCEIGGSSEEYQIARYSCGIWDIDGILVQDDICNIENRFSAKVTHWRPIPKL